MLFKDSTKFTEEDIRPSRFDEDHEKVILQDVEMLLNKRHEFVHVSCPACNSDRFVHRFVKREFNYVECNRCQTLFVNPRPSSEILDWFYRESKNYAFWNRHIFPTTEQSRREKIILPRVKRTVDLCRKYNVKMDSILEVGAGFGTFCIEIRAEKLFEHVIGVEPTPDLAESCRRKGIEIIELPLEKIEFPDNALFDVVVSFEVIEHLFSPREFFSHIFRLLKPGGIVILSCPNGRGFEVETLGPLSDTIDHEHLNYFNPNSISMLLDSCGFKVLEVFTPGVLDAELVRKKAIDKTFDLSQSPFLQQVLIKDWGKLGALFQKFLSDYSFSSNMWAVAQKNK